MGRCGLFIDGGERVPASGSYSIMENPATGKSLVQVALRSTGGHRRGGTGRRARFSRTRSRLVAAERAKHLLRVAQALSDNKDAIALVNTRETGKPVRESAKVIWRAEDALGQP